MKFGDGWTQSDWRDFLDERAAILEYDGGYSRREAEQRAAVEVSKLRRGEGV